MSSSFQPFKAVADKFLFLGKNKTKLQKTFDNRMSGMSKMFSTMKPGNQSNLISEE